MNLIRVALVFCVVCCYSTGQLHAPFSDMVSIVEALLSITAKDEENVILVNMFLCTQDERINLTQANLHRIDKSLETIFIIHGWTEASTRPWYQEMIAAYMKLGDFNLIAVDWSLPANKRYTLSVLNTHTVGDYIGDFIIKLNRNYDIPLENVHVIGHSLGGQTAGFTGKRVLKKTNKRIKRITALDPAGPFYDGTKFTDEIRLSKNDAEVVDVIHTDAGYFGMSSPCGTIDFYPNGGTNLQPGCLEMSNPFDILETEGCKRTNLAEISQHIKLIVLDKVFCSHTRSIRFFIESINSKALVGRKCDSWLSYTKGTCKNNEENVLGQHTDFNKTGIFYLTTNAKPPFARDTKYRNTPTDMDMDT